METDKNVLEAFNERREEVTNPNRSQIFWETILGELERCTDFPELQTCAAVILNDRIAPIRHQEKGVRFRNDVDFIDAVAQSSLPDELKSSYDAVWVLGDGNCLPRSLSHAYIGDDHMHIELRARIALEGIVNKERYLNPNVMNRGSTIVRESILEVYGQYSDYYRSGQILTEDTIEYLYCREMHECCKMNSYMGLWQLAQAATVMGLEIKSVYPLFGDPVMRQDFNRSFIPATIGTSVGKNEQNTSISIMWTAVRRGSVPGHFVPLLDKDKKYAKLLIYIINFVYVLIISSLLIFRLGSSQSVAEKI